MKECPSCHRTYSDDTLSFCLEDGSLLSAPLKSQPEQETVVKPNSAGLPPTPFYSPPAEIPTAAAPKNEFPAYRSPAESSRISGSNDESLAFSAGRTFRKFSLGWLLFVLFVLVLAAIYTLSSLPLIVGLFVALIYLAYILLKKNRHN